MKMMILAFAALAAGLASTGATATEPESCAAVRLAEPGWNDLALTTGTALTVLDALGYKPESSLLGIDVIYQALASGGLDVFLGYWDPAMKSYSDRYVAAGDVERVRVNLEGAKYTFAVPAYVYDAGVHDIADLAKFADQFDSKMYGIEPGSNTQALSIVADPTFGLNGWEVVESSEVGMLTAVQRAVERKEFIVFQGWAPHPMNTRLDIRYLTGGDAYYGPDFGAATVSTEVRKGYLADCPNVGQFLKNLTFSVDFENEGMGYLIDDGMDPREAGKKALQAHPDVLNSWLEGVTTLDGQPALPAVLASLAQ